MEIHRGIARLFCALLVCRAIETLAGSPALRRGRPKLVVEPMHHRALVGSRTVKEERPGLMEHMAAARKRREAAHQKVTMNLDADVPSEVVNMQEADHVAEDVLKNLDEDTASEDTASEDDKDDEKDDATSVDSTSTSSTEASKASKVEAGQTWARAQPKRAVDASTSTEVKPSVSEAHVEKMTRQLEGVKKTWSTAQDEVNKLQDKIPQSIGAEVAKLQAKSTENHGSSEDEEESLAKWAKGEADKVAWAKGAADKVAGTVSNTNSWSAAEHVVGEATTSTDQDSKTQQEQDKAEDATQDRDDDDDDVATQVEDQKDQTSAQADAVINRIKARLAAANAAADAKVAAEKAAAEQAVAEKRAAEEKAEAEKKAQEAARKAAEKAAERARSKTAEKAAVAKKAAMKAAAEKAAAEKAAAEKTAIEKAAAEKAAAEKAMAEKVAAEKAAAAVERKAADKKAAAAQRAAAAKKAAAEKEKAVVEKTDAASAVAVEDEDGDDDDHDADHVVAPGVQHKPVKAQDIQAAAPTILSPEPVNLAIGGARAVSAADTDMNSDSSPFVETLDAQEDPSADSDGEATQLAHKKTVEAKSSHDEAWFEEDGGDAQPSSEEVAEATESSQDSEGNVGWTDDELAEQETEEDDLSTSESDSSEEDLAASDMASESESLPEDAEYEDQEEIVPEDEVEGESEADIEEDVDEALLQMPSRHNFRRASP